MSRRRTVVFKREELTGLVAAINEDSSNAALTLNEDECLQLEGILSANPELWPVGIADTFRLLGQRLQWQEIDRADIPRAMLDFFDDKFRRDLDPMALAREIGQDIHSSCEDCTCRC